MGTRQNGGTDSCSTVPRGGCMGKTAQRPVKNHDQWGGNTQLILLQPVIASEGIIYIIIYINTTTNTL